MMRKKKRAFDLLGKKCGRLSVISIAEKDQRYGSTRFLCRCDCGTEKIIGGRGIRFKFSNFLEFYREIGPRPSPEYSLDRIDNEGHYESGNVRWLTRKEQARNRRCNNCIELRGNIEKLYFELADDGVRA